MNSTAILLPFGWPFGVRLFYRITNGKSDRLLAEELAFRGYLIRKLIARDFEDIPLGQFTWLSFLLSSVLFGLLHGRWVAGILAGMGFAFALYRRGKLGDAVAAHMTTNALIAAYVLVCQEWSLWT
jgi:CAAX prenyl protease-like protein